MKWNLYDKPSDVLLPIIQLLKLITTMNIPILHNFCYSTIPKNDISLTKYDTRKIFNNLSLSLNWIF